MYRRFNYLFAFVAVGLCISPGLLAQTLQPYQQEALDAILATMDEPSRPMVRAQMEPILITMNPAQVQVMLQSMQASEQEQAVIEAQSEPDFSDRATTPEDLEYNRSQYEPVIRAAWQAQKSFDDFVHAELQSACTPKREFAVFGSGWRFELYPLNPTWPQASNSADIDVQIYAATAAELGGRYEYDFSQVRSGFDRDAVKAAIQTACADYQRIGEEFLSQATQQISNSNLERGPALEAAANGKVSPVREKLNSSLEQLSPAGNGALFMAMMNGERVG